MDNRPIGVFDSGLGGLTTVSELRKIMPNEDIVYFGDTSRVPYGTRSHETIQKYAMQDIRFLLSHNVKIVIAACGTASSVLPHELTDELPCLYTGVPIPAAIAAAKATINKRVGAIGTSATIKAGAYVAALLDIDREISVFTNACPLFVPLVENGFTQADNEVTRLVAEQYLSPLKEKEIDTLILGCTHYPIIKSIIRKVMGENITLIDSGQEAARQACKLLVEHDMCNLNKSRPECSYYVSDTVESFAENASAILKEAVITHVKTINIEEYE